PFVPEDPQLAAVPDEREPEGERLETLARHGFGDPARALGELRRLIRPRGPFAPGGASARLLPWLVEELSRTIDPDRALGHFAAWATALRAPRAYFDLLLDNRPSLRRLFSLFGGSDLLSREFLLHPELLDRLLPARPPPAFKDEAELARELDGRLRGEPDPERVLASACRFRNEELLRLGLLDLSGELTTDDVSAQLSALARAVVAKVLDLARAEIVERYGRPGEGAELSVVAMGSLGGGELSVGSDLDLLFLYSAGGESSGGSRGRVSNQEYFARASQRLIGLLAMPLPGGVLYRIDSRLRPSGNQGALVTSLAAFREYHETRASLWERQALLKAAFGAGARAPFQRAEAEVILPLVYAPREPRETAAEIARLRRRMELELALESPGRYNPKLGRGGLVDIEFTVQFLQLVHGHRHPELRTPSTGAALAAVGALGLVDRALWETLMQGHAFLRRLESHLRILLDVRQTHLPREPRALAALGRRLGFFGEQADRGPGDRLLLTYARVTAGVREAFERIVAAQ
ncbi:MAG: [protein-PII] uridylyltransferase family protein, partial [Deltaproteobacteria bacterium]